MARLFALIGGDELVGILLIFSDTLDIFLITLAGLLIALPHLVVWLPSSFAEGTALVNFLLLDGFLFVLVALFPPEEGISLPFVAVPGVAELRKMLS